MLQSGRAHYYYHLRAVQLQAEKYYVMGKKIANINALRIQKRYEGQGHISKLMQEMEQFAIRNHLSRLTIGVEAKETRTLAIYLHLGFTKFLFAEMEDGELVLYFSKQISPINSRK